MATIGEPPHTDLSKVDFTAMRLQYPNAAPALTDEEVFADYTTYHGVAPLLWGIECDCVHCHIPPFEVIDLDEDETHGRYETLAEARKHARKLRAYEIRQEGLGRVEHCDPYDGDDDRIKQALGQANASEVEL